MKLPEVLRPRGSRYRHVQPGVDLSSDFIHNLRAIDEKFYLVWHPYRVLWDNIINDYEGEIENPRYTIHEKYGKIVFGFVLTDGQGAPLPDNTWHVWRLCDPYGWGHIIPVLNRDKEYLRLLLSSLHKQANWHDKYGFKSYNRVMEETEARQRDKVREEHEDLMSCWQQENKWLLNKAADNMSRGITAPTNPQKETIISGAGIKHRSRIITPLEDEAGGIVSE